MPVSVTDRADGDDVRISAIFGDANLVTGFFQRLDRALQDGVVHAVDKVDALILHLGNQRGRAVIAVLRAKSFIRFANEVDAGAFDAFHEGVDRQRIAAVGDGIGHADGIAALAGQLLAGFNPGVPGFHHHFTGIAGAQGVIRPGVANHVLLGIL